MSSILELYCLARWSHASMEVFQEMGDDNKFLSISPTPGQVPVSTNGKKRKLKEKIHSCLPLQISETDNLPRYLCFKCVFNLDNFYTFRRSCVEAVNMLKVFAAQAMESKVKAQQSQANANTSLSMVHNLLPQVMLDYML
ncbi:uncharacterized protein LOC103508480 [Diaphorina citri]|uniref:Uncharacterized protein LOC103508480 n=1 Tax=Diaphorina citri TaxID=121845 RepID=A0A3Q0IWV6_DIACI|nr:uncharacterized protein LOC103508480 [Diaphorina citri]